MENVTPAVQQVAPNMTLHWLHDHQIAYFTIRTVSRTSWAAWAKTMMALKDECPIDHPFLSLQDNLYPDAGFTSTIREYADQVSSYRPELLEYSAVILPKTLVAQMVDLFLRSSHRVHSGIRVFFNAEDGLAWLESKLIRA